MDGIQCADNACVAGHVTPCPRKANCYEKFNCVVSTLILPQVERALERRTFVIVISD